MIEVRLFQGAATRGLRMFPIRELRDRMALSELQTGARMRITGRERLEVFCSNHVDARGWIERWLADLELAAWTKPQDIRNLYASASFLPDNIVVFNVKGNAYRLEVAIAYRIQMVAIRWAGTHREYDARNRRR